MKSNFIRKRKILIKQMLISKAKKYHRAMIAQKRQEKEHLEMLVNYLEKSLMEAGMTEAMEKQIRFEQNRILKNIDDVTENLEEMCNSTLYLNRFLLNSKLKFT